MSSATMTASSGTSLSRIKKSLGRAFAGVFGLTAREYVECVREALAMSRFVDSRGTMSPSQMQELRVMAGFDASPK